MKAHLGKLSLRKPVGALLAIQWVIYFTSCWLVPPRQFVSPSAASNWKIGSSDYLAERCAFAVGGKFILELRRLFVPIFLHWNPLHILGNSSFQVGVGPYVLDKYGARLYITIFLASGICGNLLSHSFQVIAVGSSTACAGLLGALAAHLWSLWSLSEDKAWRAWVRNMVCLASVILLATEVVGWYVIDHFGHLGGLLSGFALGVVLVRDGPTPPNLYTKKAVCSVLLAIFVSVCCIKIFFWGPSPSNAVCEQKWSGYSS
jgi:membrane associated rhomboid family serine protease